MNPTRAKLIQFVGKVALDDTQHRTHRVGVQILCEAQEKADPHIKKAEIKDSIPHKSHDDPNDPEEVISVHFKDENDKRIGTAHVYKNGTGKVSWKK
ncbi:MAG: hypothetical protein M1834_002551 [Cirrosporium novae-zelandiae]|nr:MAG: hypothetical protein M1834_002551 [Cirrosporium novae-zelandiae]